MEIWIIIGGLLASGFVVYLGCVAFENIQMNKWMRERHLRELKLAMMQLEQPEFFSRTYDVSADEIRKALEKVRTVTGTSLYSNEELEEMGQLRS
jgi:hypothetical protein